jgi:hypothetical protein
MGTHIPNQMFKNIKGSSQTQYPFAKKPIDLLDLEKIIHHPILWSAILSKDYDMYVQLYLAYLDKKNREWNPKITVPDCISSIWGGPVVNQRTR